MGCPCTSNLARQDLLKLVLLVLKLGCVLLVESVHHLFNLCLGSKLPRVNRFFYFGLLCWISRVLHPFKILIGRLRILDRVELRIRPIPRECLVFIILSVFVVFIGAKGSVQVSAHLLPQLILELVSDNGVGTTALTHQALAKLVVGLPEDFVIEEGLKGVRIILTHILINHRCHFRDRYKVQSASLLHFLPNQAINDRFVIVSLHPYNGWSPIQDIATGGPR